MLRATRKHCERFLRWAGFMLNWKFLCIFKSMIMIFKTVYSINIFMCYLLLKISLVIYTSFLFFSLMMWIHIKIINLSNNIHRYILLWCLFFKKVCQKYSYWSERNVQCNGVILYHEYFVISHSHYIIYFEQISTTTRS